MEYKICNIYQDEHLVKVCCQIDKIGVQNVQQHLHSFSVRFDDGIGAVHNLSDILTSKVIAVKKDNAYYRAKPLAQDNRGIIVRLIDFGVTDCVPINHVRLINFSPFIEYAAEGFAHEFVLCDVATMRKWMPNEYSFIHYILQQPLECNVVGELAGQRLIKVTVRGMGNLSDILNEKSMVVKVSIHTLENKISNMIPNQTQRAFMPVNNSIEQPVGTLQLHNLQDPIASQNNYGVQESLCQLQRTTSVYQQSVIPSQGKFQTGERNVASSSNLLNTVPYHQRITPPQARPETRVGIVTSPNVLNTVPVQHPTTTCVQPIQQFSPVILQKGIKYHVRVSCIVDGPSHFTIQLKELVDNDLPMLTASINATSPERINGPVLPGTLCLAPTSDNILCRAVVTALKKNEASVYFVDFGNKADVPLFNIFKIHPSFMQKRAMANKVILADLDVELLSSGAKNHFSTLVKNEYVFLEVKEQDEVGNYYVEVYIVENGTFVNVKTKMRFFRYEPIILDRDDKRTVIISHVDSVKKIYVRLLEHEFSFKKMMESLQDYCQKTSYDAFLSVEDLYCGMPVCSVFMDEEKWYRAIILDISNASCITVQFIDYGNIDVVSVEALLKIPPEFVKARALALQCELDTDIDDESVAATDIFFDLVYEQKCNLHVLNVLPSDIILVRLIIIDTGESVSEIFKNALSDCVPVTNLTDIKNSLTPACTNSDDVSWESSIVKHIPTKYEPSDQRESAKRDSDNNKEDKQVSNYRKKGGSGDELLFSNYRKKDSSGDEVRNYNDRNESRQFRSRINDRRAIENDDFTNERNDDRKRDFKNKSSARSGDDQRKYRKNWRDDSSSDSYDKQEPSSNDYNRNKGNVRKTDFKESVTSYGRDDFSNKFKDDNRGDRKQFSNYKTNNAVEDKSDGRTNWNRRNNDRYNDDAGYRKKSVTTEEPSDNLHRGDNKFSQKTSRTPYDKRWDTSQSGQRNTGDNDNDDDNGNNYTRGRAPTSWRNNDYNYKKDDTGGRRNFNDRTNKSSSQTSGSKTSNYFNNDSHKVDNVSSVLTDAWDESANTSGSTKTSNYRNNSHKVDTSVTTDNRHNATESANNWKLDQKKPLLDSFPVGSEILEPDCANGDSYKVCVTFINNPSSFYAQLIDDKFEELMLTIQKEYKQRKSLSEDDMKPGIHVIVENADNMLYRGCLLSIDQSDATVKLLDYGESITCKKDRVWAINPDHCALQIRAIHCSLNLTPKTVSQWSDLSCSTFDVYFNEDEYTLKILNYYYDDDGGVLYEVDMQNEAGQNISKRLIDDGLAKVEISLDDEPVDSNMLLDQRIIAYSIWCDSSEKFYIHIEIDKARAIENELDKIKDKLNKLSQEDIVEKMFCIVKSDDFIYRASVLSVNDQDNKVHVRFVDYGDEDDVPLEQLYNVPTHLLLYNSQAFECSLYNVGQLSEDIEDEIRTSLQEKDLIIHVNEVHNNRLSVTVYNTNGSPLVTRQTSDCINPVVSMPVLRLKEVVIVNGLTVEDGLLIAHLNFVSMKSVLVDLQSSLINYYESETADRNKLSPDRYEIGRACAVKYTNQWYRAKILSYDELNVRVYLIDHGLEISVSSDFTRELKETLYYPHELSLRASTGISVEGNYDRDDKLLRDFLTKLGDRQFEAEFSYLNLTTMFKVNLRGNEKNLIDYAKEAGLVVTTGEVMKDDADEEFKLIDLLQDNIKRNAIVTYIEWPTSFTIRLAEGEFNAFQLTLERVTEFSPIFVADSSHCGLFLAKWIEDDKERWYRVEVTNKTARFIDFGYRLENCPILLKRLPSRFERPVNYAVDCTLDVEPIDSEIGWTEEARERFNQLLTSPAGEYLSDVEMILPNSRDNRHTVRLSTEDVTDVADVLISEGLAARACYDVTVSCATNVIDFYVQLTEGTERLNKLMEQLNNSNLVEEVDLENKRSADLVGVKCDGIWYRGLVDKKIEGERYKVELIDYGNTVECDSIFRLPDELGDVSRFAINCRLFNENDPIYVAAIDERGFSDKFKAIIAENEGVISLELSPAFKESRLVTLYIGDDWRSVKDLLIDDRIEHYRVIITHINDATSFYVRSKDNEYVDILSQLYSDNRIARDLLEVTTPTINRLYAVEYPNGKWCRVKITDEFNNNNEYKVLAIDYGYETVVSSAIRELPSNLESLPAQAVHCSLVPPSNGTWFERSGDSFRELCFSKNGDESPVYEMKITERGTDRLIVSLSDNGSSLSEELAATFSTISTTNKRKPIPIVISAIESLSLFWIQTGNDSAGVEEMREELKSSDTFDSIAEEANNNNASTLVAAFKTTDSEWRRAEIISSSSTDDVIEYKVRYVDYGDIGLAHRIKQLPEDLKSLPPLAKKCRLKLPPHLDDWSDKHLSRFVNVVRIDKRPLYLNELIDEEPNTVSLTMDDYSDLSAYLADSSWKNMHLITRFESLSDFYVADSDELNAATLMLDTNEPLSSDRIENEALVTVVIDDKPYRAKVLSIDDVENIRVYRVDIGDTVSCSKVFKLETRTTHLPPLAIKCRLILPDTLTEWPDEVSDKFRHVYLSDNRNSFVVTFVSTTEDGCNLVHLRVKNDDGDFTDVNVVITNFYGNGTDSTKPESEVYNEVEKMRSEELIDSGETDQNTIDEKTNINNNDHYRVTDEENENGTAIIINPTADENHHPIIKHYRDDDSNKLDDDSNKLDDDSNKLDDDSNKFDDDSNKLDDDNDDKIVLISHINSPASFYVQRSSTTLTEVFESLKYAEETFEPIIGPVTTGTIIAVKFEHDRTWRRAKILNSEQPDDNISVFFIDYGNTAIVSSEFAKRLPDKLASIPPLAMHCCLPMKRNIVTEELIAIQNTPVCLILIEDGDPAIVDLKNVDTGTNISELLKDDDITTGDL